MVVIKNPIASTELGVSYIRITFRIEDTYEDLNLYKFSILKSNSESGPFDILAINIKEFEFIDHDVNLYSQSINYYYKILVEDADGNKKESEIFHANKADCDEYSSYFIDIYSMYLDCAINNKQMILLKRKRTGQLCECYDDVRHTTRKTNCPICFETKYVGGYYNPITINVCFANTSMITERMEPTAVTQENSPIQLWTENYPIIQENDILINTVTGKRYIVVSCQQSIKNGFIIRQTLQIQKIQESSVVYKIPIS